MPKSDLIDDRSVETSLYSYFYLTQYLGGVGGIVMALVRVDESSFTYNVGIIGVTRDIMGTVQTAHNLAISVLTFRVFKIYI